MPWVLTLDADYELSRELSGEIAELKPIRLLIKRERLESGDFEAKSSSSGTAIPTDKL